MARSFIGKPLSFASSIMCPTAPGLFTKARAVTMRRLFILRQRTGEGTGLEIRRRSGPDGGATRARRTPATIPPRATAKFLRDRLVDRGLLALAA